MKKPTAPKKTTTKKLPPTWQENAAKLPIALFHTTMGPIIGKVDKAPADHGQFRIRVWVPAVLQIGVAPPVEGSTAIQQRVVFQPLALVETYIDLSVATPFGRSPVPESVVPGYEEYFAKFVGGGGNLRRVVSKVEQDAQHVADVPAPAPEAPPKVVSDPSQEPAASESEDSNVS